MLTKGAYHLKPGGCFVLSDKEDDNLKNKETFTLRPLSRLLPKSHFGLFFAQESKK
jgi:hypothetical protein